MEINFLTEDIDFGIDDSSTIENWIKQTIESERPTKSIGDINIVFTSDEYLLKINKEYLNHDFYTDIITFDYNSDSTISGDLLISIERIKENAKKFSATFKTELHRVIIHGILHLLGYQDKLEEHKEQMTNKENFYLELLRSLFRHLQTITHNS